MSDQVEGLSDAVQRWIGRSPFNSIKNDAIRHVNHVGAEKFVEELIHGFLAEHAKPFQHELEWENFTLQLAMNIWFSESDQKFDLIVLPCDDTFDFSAYELATNGWLASRGENLELIMEYCKSRRQANERAVIVKSTNHADMSYCFVPVLHKEPDGKHSASLDVVRAGLRDVLKAIVFKKEDANTVYRSVFVIPFGLEVLSDDMDDLVWIIWNELRAAGRTRPYDIKKRIEGLKIRLAFGLPNVVSSFLKVMLDEGEALTCSNRALENGNALAPDVYFPPSITPTWIKKYSDDFLKARANPDEWPKVLSRVGTDAENVCTNIQHNGGLVGVTLRDKLNSMFPDRVERMLIARRVIVAYSELVKARKRDYPTLVRELGFVAKDEASAFGDTDSPKIDSFKVYLGELGLSKAALTDPYRNNTLWPEELDWLIGYAGPAD